MAQARNYSSNFYNKPYNTGQLFSKNDFMEQIAETTKIFELKKRPLPGPILQTDVINRKILKNYNFLDINGKLNIQNIEKRDLFSKAEKKLWKSEDWRKRDKNFGNSFKKLSPIHENI